jgi:hypothetical protein
MYHVLAVMTEQRTRVATKFDPPFLKGLALLELPVVRLCLSYVPGGSVHSRSVLALLEVPRLELKIEVELLGLGYDIYR